MRAIVTKVHLHDGRLLARDLRGHARRGHWRGRPAHRAHVAIVGGTPISIAQAPWQVAVIAVLSETEALICGGSILSPTEVLTAGHCVFNPETSARIPAGDIVVGAGTANIDVKPPQVTLASTVRVHPYFAYNPNATQAVPDDVAVLELETPLVFNTDVEAINLAPAGSLLPEGTPVNLTGFGQENPAQELSGELHSISMGLGFSGVCGGEADALFLCASSPSGSDCFGDSGSALTVPGSPATLVGVTDTTEVIDGQPCLDGSVGGFVNVAAPEIGDFIVGDSPDPPMAPRGGEASLLGTPASGDTLSCERGSWSGGPTFTYTFVNAGGGQVLQQGSSSSYPLTGADVGRTIDCVVSAANAGGTGADQTSVVGPIRPSRQEEEAAQLRILDESLARDAREAAARHKQEEEAAAAQKNGGAQGVAGIQEGASAPVPDAKLASTAFEASASGAVTIKVSCPAAESSCSGTVTLRTLDAVSAAAGGAARSKKAILTLASGSFTVAGGFVKTVTLHLSAKARALLSRSHVLRVRATIVAHDPAGAAHTTQTVATLRAPKTKHGKG